MTKRIFRGIACTALLAAALVAALVALLLYRAGETNTASQLRAEAGYINHALSREADDAAYFADFSSDNRVTLVASDGTVLYDSLADASALPNHASRPEVASALLTGRGESKRYSDTLATTTLYYAEKTADGNVLRVSNTRLSILRLLRNLLPALLAALLGVTAISLCIAKSIAKRIVTPLNALDLDAPLTNDVYDELSPLLLRMDRQQKEIAARMQALREKQTELAAITESMREGLLLLDADNAVLAMNGSAASIFGADATLRIGYDMLAVTRDAAVNAAVADARAGKSADAVFEREGRCYQALASPVVQNGGIAGVVLLLMDVTEKRAAELSRREFTANVSHELKTPLTSILGYAEIMRDSVARPEDTKRFSARIYDEARRLIALIDDIIALSRLDERRGLGEREPVALLPIVNEVAKRLAPLAEQKGIALSVGGADGKVEGFPALLTQMVYNLVDNAIKYTDCGSVRVDVEAATDGVTLTVTDTGVGIPPDDQPHVFERFYRVDKSHSKATGGTGLGLSIVRHGAAAHGATVALESELGSGTRVRLTFPAL